MTKRERQAFRALYTAADRFKRAHEWPNSTRIEVDEKQAAMVCLLEALVLAAEVLPSDAPRDVRLGDCGCSDAAGCARGRRS